MKMQKDISRSLNYVINRLTRTFDINEEDFKIHVRKNDDPFKELTRKALNYFEYMDTVITFGEKFEDKIVLVSENPIPKEYKYLKRYEDLSEEKRFQKMPYQITVLNKDGQDENINFSFSGWVGTIHERGTFKNFLTKQYSEDGKTKFEVSLTDNRITIFSRGKNC